MASLKECRARAKAHGFKVVAIPKKQIEARIKSDRKVYRYRVNGWHCTDVKDLTHAISSKIRGMKRSEMMLKLNGHRPKYGYKTVPRKSRKK